MSSLWDLKPTGKAAELVKRITDEADKHRSHEKSVREPSFKGDVLPDAVIKLVIARVNYHLRAIIIYPEGRLIAAIIHQAIRDNSRKSIAWAKSMMPRLDSDIQQIFKHLGVHHGK